MTFEDDVSLASVGFNTLHFENSEIPFQISISKLYTNFKVLLMASQYAYLRHGSQFWMFISELVESGTNFCSAGSCKRSSPYCSPLHDCIRILEQNILFWRFSSFSSVV